MERIWQSAPAPALHVVRSAQGLRVQPNEVAARWAARHGVDEAGWRALAAQALAADAPEALEVVLGPQPVCVQCRRVALDGDAWLLWLDAAAVAIDDRTRLVAEVIGVGFWSRDLDTGIAFWDAQMYRIHRRPPEAGPPGFDDWIEHHVHPHDRAWVSELHQRATAHWEPIVDATFRVPADGGGERWVQTWTRRLVRGGRRLAFGMHLDVTDRERTQAQLGRERERTHFAIEAAGVGVWERGLDGGIVYWNDAMYRLRGFEPDDPRSPDELAELTSHPDDHVEMQRAVQRHVEQGLPYRFEFRVRRADGPWRWIATQGRALRDSDGRVLGMAGVNIDITERKETDALRLQKARAEQASRDKSAFMARLSHELRTPMNAVLGFTQLLDDDSVDPPTERQRDRLRRIGEAGTHMMSLIDDLLDLAGLESALPGAAAPVPVADVLHQVHAAVAAAAGRRGVVLRLVPPPAPLAVRADRRRLAQALTHLAGHAVHQQRAGGWVEIGALPDGAGSAARVVLSVADDGPGYSDSERAMLFEPFVRRGGDGTGIGLSLAQRVVQALGGEIEAQPRSGGGTEIRLRLPAETAAAAAAPAATPAPAAGASASDVGAAVPLKILCVEDNPVNLMLVREMLALRPAVMLREAVNGHGGIELALAERPDVLLLDLQLPDIGGIEVMQRLRAVPALQGSVFIALSANAMPEQVAAARAAGFDDYWTKPIDFTRFLAAIDGLAQGASRSRTQSPPSSR